MPDMPHTGMTAPKGGRGTAGAAPEPRSVTSEEDAFDAIDGVCVCVAINW